MVNSRESLRWWTPCSGAVSAAEGLCWSLVVGGAGDVGAGRAGGVAAGVAGAGGGCGGVGSTGGGVGRAGVVGATRRELLGL